MVWLDLFKELFYLLEQKKAFIQMLIRKIGSEKFPNDGKTIIWKKEFFAFIHLSRYRSKLIFYFIKN